MSPRRAGLLVSIAIAAAAALVHVSAAAAAPWCGAVGTSNRPAAVAGSQIRVIYAIPSDGADNSATVAPQLSADVDLIDTWWRGQDPTRAPRFDRTPFSCGLQADIQLLRLPVTGEQLRSVETRFDLINQAVAPLDRFAPYYKYLVYYDGPLGEVDLCGQGGGFFDGPGIAIVYVGACVGEPSVAVAAHELLHSLGAVPDGAAHPCGPEDLAHVCDSSTDVMWPFATLVPLTSLALDVNRDDYYAHSGSWLDMQDSRWLTRLDAQVPLALTVQGQGLVVSDVPGVECATSCQTSWDAGSVVTLMPQAAGGQKMVRWGGACTGSGSCSVTLAAATGVTALFAPERFGLRVSIGGRGVVKGASGRVSCPSRCAASVPSYTATRLVASATKGWRFAGWSGACRGTRPVCTLPMTKSASARARFARAAV